MRHGIKLSVAAALFSTLTLSALAQRADIAVVGGGGFAGGDDQETSGALVVGASLGFPYLARHRFQFDYSFTNVEGEVRIPEAGLNGREADSRNQFVTASYILQARRGRARPFFQIGAGIVHRRYPVAAFGPPNKTTHGTETGTSLAVLFGAGVTFDLGRSLFIRPHVRLYGHVGPTLTVLPGVGFGYRF